MTEQNFWKVNISAFSSLFEKPKMNEKLLQRPPFKYLFDIILATIEITGCGQGLYSQQEKNHNYYQVKELKIIFLQKIIDFTQHTIGKGLSARPTKIIAGLEPENTNIFLQEFYRCVTTPSLNKKSPIIIQKLFEKYEQESKERDQQQPQQTEENPNRKEIKYYQINTQQQSLSVDNKINEMADTFIATNNNELVIAPTQQIINSQKVSKLLPKSQRGITQLQDNPTQSKNRGTIGIIKDNKTHQNDDDQENSGHQNTNQNIQETAEVRNQRINFFVDQNKDYVMEKEKDFKQIDNKTINPSDFKLRLQGIKKKREQGSLLPFPQCVAVEQTQKLDSNSGTEISQLSFLIQEITKSTNPLGKSLEFIKDDLESMNIEFDFWTKSYISSKENLQAELRASDEILQPIIDQLAEMSEKIGNKKREILEAQAQVIKNQSQIQTLLNSVVQTN